MLPSFRSSPPRYHQRRLLVVTLLFVGICAFVNMYNLRYYSSAASTRKDEQRHARGVQESHVLAPELIEFVQNGGFDDSEKVEVKPNAFVVHRPSGTPLLGRTGAEVEVIQNVPSMELPVDEHESSQNPEKPHRKKAALPPSSGSESSSTPQRTTTTARTSKEATISQTKGREATAGTDASKEATISQTKSRKT